MAKRPTPSPHQAEPVRPRQDADDWRLFIAIPLPESVRDAIRKISSTPAVAALPLRLVNPDLAHITLHFLGETPAERAELLSLALGADLADQRPARLQTSHLGFFPNERKPRVFWLGLEGETDRVLAVHEVLRHSLISLGFEVDRKPFRPHITIGRVRDGSHPRLAEDVRIMLADPRVRGLSNRSDIQFVASEVQLIRSHLEKSGPRYEVLRRYPLLER